MPVVRKAARPPSDWAVPPGHVGLFCADPWLQTIVPLGADPPRISGGVGGWEITSRPRQVAMTTWAGTDPYQLDVAVVFDGFAGERPQEGALRRLYTAARGDDDSDPRPWIIAGIPNLPADRWVLQSIDAGDVIRRTRDMKRTRQAVALTFVEYVPPEWVRLRKKALAGRKTKTVVYTCKKDDTPNRIARKRQCEWTDLRDLNPKTIRKANQDLKKGQKLRVPVARRKGKREGKRGGNK